MGQTRDDLFLPEIRLVEPPQLWHNPPPWGWRTTIPDYFNFWYALEGHGELWVDDRVYVVEPGTAFLLPPGTRVRGSQRDRAAITNFAAHLRFTGGGRRRQAPVILGERVTDAVQFEGRLREVASKARQRDALARREAAAMVFLALAAVWRAVRQRPGVAAARIEVLLDEIDTHPGKYARIDEMARRAAMSPAHLRRQFQARVGVSPMDYVQRRRLERARALLQASPLTVKEIAHVLGYEDPLYFSRQFRRHVGESPTAWRGRACRTKS